MLIGFVLAAGGAIMVFIAGAVQKYGAESYIESNKIGGAFQVWGLRVVGIASFIIGIFSIFGVLTLPIRHPVD